MTALFIKGYNSCTLQIGKGIFPKSLIEKSTFPQHQEVDSVFDNYCTALDRGETIHMKVQLQLKDDPLQPIFKVSAFRFKPNISLDMSSADLIVSHAGAGSSIEALSFNKPLLTVVNDNLMDQHQTELAEELYLNNYSMACKPETLRQTLLDFNEDSLQKFIPGNPEKFMQYMDSVCINVE